MTSKSKQEEALKFLDDLDSFATPETRAKSSPPLAGTGAGAGAAQGSSKTSKTSTTTNEAEVLAFIDEITQKSAEPPRPPSTHNIPRAGTPTTAVRKSTERVRLGGGPVGSAAPSASSSTASLQRTASGDGNNRLKDPSASASASSNAAAAGGGGGVGGGWGWGSVWSTASAAIQQAKTAVDEQVKHLPKNEQVRNWGEGVLEYAKTAQLDKLGKDFKRVGLSTLTDILNVVAPPISEHEVIQIWLSHDMQGYEGVESLVYRALARILEQVEGGDLIVNRGNESKPREGAAANGRDLDAVEGYEAAIKLAQANIITLVESNSRLEPKASTVNTPTTYSNVYLRIQPFFTNFALPGHDDASSSSSPETSASVSQKLQFLVYLYDPEHKLTHTSITQAVSAQWLAIWDDYDWVEDLVADALRIGVEVIGQEYVVSRMGWVGRGGQEKDQKETDPANRDADEHAES